MINGQIFKNLNKVVEHLNEKGWSLSKSYFKNAPFQAIDYGDNKIVYYPEPLFSPLFRGQNELYEPCLASIYRRKVDDIEKFIFNLKIEEFRIIALKHPVIKHEVNNGLFFDHVALAQHYEFQTNMLDMTNSLPVAAFFAVTKRDSKGYIPILKSEKPGVLYFISPNIHLNLSFNGEGPEAYPVGLQSFKRPGEQRAFGIKLDNRKDFNSISGVFAFMFWQDRNISEKIYQMFNGGEDLFPFDIFAEQAAQVKWYNVFSQSSFDVVYDNSNTGLTKRIMIIELQKRNVTIKPNHFFNSHSMHF